MSVHCFTSASFNYLAKARVLGRTLKKFHPDWKMSICVTDKEPPGFTFDLSDEPFDDVIWSHELDLSNPQAWLFQHEIVEACTAVKGPVLRKLLDEGANAVVYLDPDIAVFNRLDPLVDLLKSNSILLTPHQLSPELRTQAILDNEFGSLLHGTYNLGFIAVANDSNGNAMAKWWDERLRAYCMDDKSDGIFVDQKWCDLVPALFDGVHVIRDPGFNVASWNLSHRKLQFDCYGNASVNGSVPLRFFHFTKLGPIGDTMTRKYAQDNVEVYELWSWYKRAVEQENLLNIPSGWWHYGTYDNGEKISKAARRTYRGRADLQTAYPNPFSTVGDCFLNWLRSNTDSQR